MPAALTGPGGGDLWPRSCLKAALRGADMPTSKWRHCLTRLSGRLTIRCGGFTRGNYCQARNGSHVDAFGRQLARRHPIGTEVQGPHPAPGGLCGFTGDPRGGHQLGRPFLKRTRHGHRRNMLAAWIPDWERGAIPQFRDASRLAATNLAAPGHFRALTRG
jgi:hypothetical protein